MTPAEITCERASQLDCLLGGIAVLQQANQVMIWWMTQVSVQLLEHRLHRICLECHGHSSRLLQAELMRLGREQPLGTPGNQVMEQSATRVQQTHEYTFQQTC